MSADSGETEAAAGQPMLHLVHGVLYFLRVLRYRKRVTLSVVAGAAALGGLYYGTATRYFRSSAQLLIRQTGGDVLSPSMVMSEAKHETMPTYEQLLHSEIVIRGTLERLTPRDQIDFRDLPRDKRIAQFAENLSTATVPHTNIVEVSYRSRNPYVASRVVQTLLDAYLDFIERTHKGTAGEIIGVLTKEKNEVAVALSQRENQLVRARQKHGDFGLKPGGEIVGPYVQRALKFNEALITAQEKRLEIQASLEALQASIRRGEDLQQHVLAVENTVGREMLLSALGFGSRDATMQASLEQDLLHDRAELKTLLKFYGPAHPDVAEVSDRVRLTEQYLDSYQGRVQRRLAELRDTQLGPLLTQMMQQALSRAWEEENSMRDSFEQARREAVQVNGELGELEILDHDVQRLRSLQDALIGQITNIKLTQEHGDIRATVVKQPSPDLRPVAPRLLIVALLAGFGALAVSGGVVYVLDTLDDRFRSADELRAQLGVPVLALVREFPPNDQLGLAAVQAFTDPDAVGIEAFRTLRTALAFSASETRRLIVSSAEPGEGKSTVLANLAVTFAQAGKHTLVIDADLRRPGLTKMLDLRGRPGLFDVLGRPQPIAETAAEYVQPLGIPGLDFLPAGHRRPNPAELLSESKLTELLAWAESAYDQVLIDTAPVLAASESLLLGRLADGVVLVVNPETNHRRMVLRTAESFSTVGSNLLGVVVNRIRGGAGDYGYGYGYGYGYAGEDSQHDDETKPSAAMPGEHDDFETGSRADEACGLNIPRRVA